jgi:hypothetical protein
VLTLRFLLIAAPLGYLALTGYLLAQVMPLPIALLPQATPEKESDHLRVPVAV